MRTCHIVGAGERTDFKITSVDGDIVVACDGGLKYLDEDNILPDVIIGDFDSLGFVPEGKKVVKLNVIKDETDVGAALRIYGDEYDRFMLYCCTGGRISHTFANIQNVLPLVKKGKEIFIFDGKETITFVNNGSVVFDNATGSFSVLSIGKSVGVSITGAKYTLLDAVLSDDYPLGVSNEFCGEKTVINVKDGTLMICFPSKSSLPVKIS